MTNNMHVNAANLLRDQPEFRSMPSAFQEWILASPNATNDFLDFFNRSGIIDQRKGAGLPYYDPGKTPRIVVDSEYWHAAKQGPVSIQMFVFGTLAHEIGHDRYNTATVLFPGGPPEDYIRYRSELEAQAIFNAFPIFNDLKDHPDFKKEYPFNSIGYVDGTQLGPYFAEWRDGLTSEATIVDRIAALIPNAEYKLSNPISDMDGNGKLTHRDLYLEHYKEMIARQPEMAIRPAVSQKQDLDSLDRLIAALGENDRTALRAERETYFKSDEGRQFLGEVAEYGQAREREAIAHLHHRGLALGSDGHSIGSLTGRRDPRDWDHPDHALYSAIRRDLPAEFSDETAAQIMQQAKQNRILHPRDIDSIDVHNGQAFIAGKHFQTAHVDLSQDPPPMQDTVQQSQLLDQQLALERAQWLAQQQELARSGPSMSL